MNCSVCNMPHWAMVRDAEGDWLCPDCWMLTQAVIDCLLTAEDEVPLKGDNACLH